MRSLLVFLLSVSLFVGSCKDKETLAPLCANAGAFVKQVNQINGVIYYDPTQRSYFVRVPNSFDSYDIGYTCSLAMEYQKSGLNVRFSGKYYESDKQTVFLAGDKNYYLSLSSITGR